MQKDLHQRFYFKESPVRGDIVTIENALSVVLEKKDYPDAVAMLLGEMMVSASLLASTIKIEGRLSIQLQSNEQDSCLQWAMAECDHEGKLRGLAKWNDESNWAEIQNAEHVLANLNQQSSNSVLFINIEPEKGQRYQGIVEQVSNSLAVCIQHYQEQSAQIPTFINIASTAHSAAGILVQKLPYNSEEAKQPLDEDLWHRILSLSNTIKANELLELPISEILYRLYHEEDVVMPDVNRLEFGCTCSKEKCLSALVQLGYQETLAVFADSAEEDNTIHMDCHFCGTPYPISKQEALKLFN